MNGVSNSKVIADLFRELFTVKVPLKEEGSVPDTENCHRQLVKTRFSAKDVAGVIKSITKGKSPGHNGLSVEHLPMMVRICRELSSVIKCMCKSFFSAPSVL